MLVSTPGIVLHVTPYSESSVVVKVFTRELGVQSYIIKGVRKGKSRTKQNLLQPLAQLDMVVYHSDRTDLHYVKELSLHTSPADPERPSAGMDILDSDPVHLALRFFVTEVIYRTLVPAEPMPDLYDHVAALDLDADPAGLPIRFLLAHAHYLGFAPLDDYAPSTPYFHLEQGCYVAESDEVTLPPTTSLLLHRYLCAASPDGGAPVESAPLKVPLADRQMLMDALLSYLRIHLPSTGQFQSPDILHQLLV